MEIILTLFHKAFSSLVPFVILLGILIFIHEFGHFIIARLCGVRVEVFSLGFGKKIFQYKRGDTNYCISIIPLGGYVKMFGDQPGAEVPEEEKQYSFTHKNVWQRISIVLAGPLMNFFFAIFVFFVVAFIGEDYRGTRIGDLAADTKAFAAGFRPGDRILSVNGNNVTTWDEFEGKLADLNNTQAMVEIQRHGTTENESLKVDITSKPNPNVLSTDDIVGDIEGLSPMSKAALIGVKPGSPLAALGLKTGDRVTAINGEKVAFWRELQPLLEKQNPAQPLQIDAERASSNGKNENLSMTLAPIGLPKYSFDTLKLESADLYLGTIIDGTPAKTAGLMPGDRLMQVNNTKIERWEDVISSVKSYDGGKEGVKVEVLRDGELLKMTIIPQMISQMTASGTEDKRYTIGVSPFINYAMPEIVKISTSNPVEAVKIGVQRTWDVSVMTVMSFVRLFEGKVSPKNIGGVISIGQAASETFKVGISPFLRMMGLISVNLFILNLLPIPILDGGHLVFYSIEALKGAPVSMKKMEIAQQVGLVLLMSLMVFALFNDFTRLFGM